MVKHSEEKCLASGIKIIPGDTRHNNAIRDMLKSGVAHHCRVCHKKWDEVQQELKNPSAKSSSSSDNRICSVSLCLGIGIGIGCTLLTWFANKRKV
jgi:hypothetical protein